MSEKRDPRLQMAVSRLGAATRRAEATDQERAEALRDLCAARIEVAVERNLATSPLPLTEEQVATITEKFRPVADE